MLKYLNKALLGVLSSIIFAIALFIVYRLGLENAGPEVFGTWVLIQSMLAIVRLPEAGIGVNLTREIAIDISKNETLRLRAYVAAGFIVCVLPIVIIGLIAIFPTLWAIEYFFESPLTRIEILSLIVINILFGCIYATGTMMNAIIEGAGRLEYKYYFLIISNLSLALMAYPLISNYGIIGLALNYFLTAVILVALATLYLTMRKINVSGGQYYGRSTSEVVKLVWRNSLTVSYMSFLRLSFEPWSKFVIGLTGGLGAVAYADLAFRVTNQVRNIVQASCQPLLTYGARTETEEPSKGKEGFALVQKVILKMNLLISCLLVVVTPVVALVGIGEMLPQFALVYITLALANGINSLGVVGYYYSVSAGNLKIILRIHVFMFILNIVGGLTSILLESLVLAIISYTMVLLYGGYALANLWLKPSCQSWKSLVFGDWLSLSLTFVMAGLSFWCYNVTTAGEPLLKLILFALTIAPLVILANLALNYSFMSSIFTKLRNVRQ